MNLLVSVKYPSLVCCTGNKPEDSSSIVSEMPGTFDRNTYQYFITIMPLVRIICAICSDMITKMGDNSKQPEEDNEFRITKTN